LIGKFDSIFKEMFIQALNLMRLVYLRGNGLTHAILPDGFGCFEEIFFKNVYFEPLRIHRADVVIDLGAHQGTFTVYSALNMRPRSILISVEPNPNAYNVLLENILLHKHLIAEKRIRVHVVNKAVYTSRRVIKFKLTKWSETPHISASGNLCVQTITLREIFSLFQHLKDPRVLLKMDIEGVEHDLLTDEQSLKFIRMCKYIAIEPHGNVDMIKETLEYLGFRTRIHNITLEPQLWKKWLNYKPKLYTSTIAAYRLIVSSIAKPKITIVKAERQ